MLQKVLLSKVVGAAPTNKYICMQENHELKGDTAASFFGE
jgi:hypothetical protein